MSWWYLAWIVAEPFVLFGVGIAAGYRYAEHLRFKRYFLSVHAVLQRMENNEVEHFSAATVFNMVSAYQELPARLLRRIKPPCFDDGHDQDQEEGEEQP